MGTCFVELRKNTARGNSISTDMMRHLHTRQYVGKALVVGSQPTSMLSAARKQWLKLSRYIQKQRASTLDADKILKYTHTVTHMQHMNFSAKYSLGAPNVDVYFVSPQSVNSLPSYCQTVYVTETLTAPQMRLLLKQLPEDALVVDYSGIQDAAGFGLRPKIELETRVTYEWQQLEHFFGTYHINVKALADGPLQDIDAMEEALDILLGASHRFLQIVGTFQRALELARPLRLSKALRQQYDAAVLLAHRVQALSTPGFTGQFLEAYNEDDTFFLYDIGRELKWLDESLPKAIARHHAAGRLHLAGALKKHLEASHHRTSGSSHKMLTKPQAM